MGRKKKTKSNKKCRIERFSRERQCGFFGSCTGSIGEMANGGGAVCITARRELRLHEGTAASSLILQESYHIREKGVQMSEKSFCTTFSFRCGAFNCFSARASKYPRLIAQLLRVKKNFDKLRDVSCCAVRKKLGERIDGGKSFWLAALPNLGYDRAVNFENVFYWSSRL